MSGHALRPAAGFTAALWEHVHSANRRNGSVERSAHWLWCAGVRAYLAVCHHLAVRGRRHLPAEPPYVLAANHLSHLDALVLASALPDCLRDRAFPIAAEDTCFEPEVRAAFVACVVNALPIDRRKWGLHGLRELRRRLLDESCVYIIFPEGTRSRTGQMGAFKGGVGMLVAGTPIPVVPCHLSGTFQALPPHRHWPRFVRITLRVGEPLTFPHVRNDRAGWDEVARVTEAAVRRLGGPTPPEVGP